MERKWRRVNICEYILSARNQILFLFSSKTESAIVHPSVIVCVLLLLISPCHICSPPPPESGPSSGNNHWAVIDSHEFTLFMTKVSGTSALRASVWRQASLWHRHTHGHCKYSRWFLRLVAALKLAHICSSIDPCVCEFVCAGPTSFHQSVWFCLCVCVCWWGRGVVLAIIVLCKFALYSSQGCLCAHQQPCVFVCPHVWADAVYPPGPDAPAKSITSGAAQRC